MRTQRGSRLRKVAVTAGALAGTAGLAYLGRGKIRRGLALWRRSGLVQKQRQATEDLVTRVRRQTSERAKKVVDRRDARRSIFQFNFRMPDLKLNSKQFRHDLREGLHRKMQSIYREAGLSPSSRYAPPPLKSSPPNLVPRGVRKRIKYGLMPKRRTSSNVVRL